MSSRSGRKPLRVLFFAGGKKFDARPYEPLFAELTRRGHSLHLAFNKLPSPDQLARLERSAAGDGSLTFGVAPGRGAFDGWRSVADLVRRLADLARYSHPRYDRAPALRARMASRILGYVGKPGRFEPLARRLALRVARRLAASSDAGLSERTIRRLARLEEAIPASGRIACYLRDRQPDVVLATAVLKKPSQVDFLKSARTLGIPTGICVPSWDNLTNKGLLKFEPERVFVWNETQRREAVELHGIAPERVVATGAQLFDEWFEREPSGSRAEFARKVGLDPARPYVVYVASSAFITAGAGEVEFVRRWVETLRADDRLGGVGVLIRPHPGVPRRWRDADLGRLGNVVVWPREGAHPVSEEMRAGFYDTIAHSAAVVGINTTAMIEAAIIGKSVLTILAPEFAQETTLHFHYLLEENGGFLHVASTPEEHVAQLLGVLDEDAAALERRRRFVESFVRPHGLDRPATPIFADAVEELAAIPVAAPRRPRRPLLRAALLPEAALSSVALASAYLAERVRAGAWKRLRQARRVGSRLRRLET